MASDVVFAAILSVQLGFCIFGTFISLIILNIIFKNHHYRTTSNILVCHTCLIAIIFFFLLGMSSIVGFHPTWAMHESTCIIRAYCVTISCISFIYSYVIQSIHRIFMIIFYHKQHLLTWRIYFLILSINWIICLILPVEPLLVNGYIYQTQSHFCVLSPNILSATIYLLIFGFLIPYTIIICLYIYARRYNRLSTTQIIPFVIFDAITRLRIQQQKDELQGLKSILIQISLYAIGNLPLIILGIYSYVSSNENIPDELYLLSHVPIPICLTFILICQCMTNPSIRRTLMADRRFSLWSQN